MNRLGAIFVILFVVYTLAWSAACWFMQKERPEPPTKYHSTPIDITTPEERVRGESTFEIARERTFGITRAGFFTIVAIGYILLARDFSCSIYQISFIGFMIPTSNIPAAGKARIALLSAIVYHRPGLPEPGR